MARHIKTQIKPDSREDKILRALMGGANWRRKSPVLVANSDYWIPAIHIVNVLDPYREGIASLSLATDISTCRHFLRQRWPQYTIVNKLKKDNGRTRSFYRIERIAQ